MRHPLGLLVACLTVISVNAQPRPDGPTSVLKVRGSENGVAVTSYAEILEDPEGNLDLDQVRTRQPGWRHGPADALTFGFSNSVWWVRLRIENTAEKRLPLIVDLGNTRQDYIHWYVLRLGGEFKTEGTTGDRLPYSQRAIPVRDFAVPLSLDPHEQAELILRLQSYDGLFEAMPLRISHQDRFLAGAAAENQLLALYHGGLVALALYNLLLFLALRERTFGLYVLHLLCFSAWSLTFRGFSHQYFWPQSPDFNNDILTVVAAFTFATLGMFAIAYLRMRELAPRWVWRLNQTLIVLNVLATVPAFMGYFAAGAAVGQILGVAISASTMATAIWLLKQGSRQAGFFAVAFAVVAVCAIAYVLQIFSILPTNWFTTWGIHVGSTIEALLLALGLADSMNELKAQKIDAERKAREAQEALNAQLAQQVNERTEALELANRRLHDLAITDELTGAFNRRHFSAFCSAALAHRDRDEPLAFCMFDVDHFKAYNERYGMPAGNAALRTIAHCIRGELRRSGDVLFRLGGEEFGVLFTAKNADSAKQFIERLRMAIHNLKIEHQDSPSSIITASFGVGWWDKGVTYRLTSDQMYAVADNMLYEAKENGRDCVCLQPHYEAGMAQHSRAS